MNEDQQVGIGVSHLVNRCCVDSECVVAFKWKHLLMDEGPVATPPAVNPSYSISYSSSRPIRCERWLHSGDKVHISHTQRMYVVNMVDHGRLLTF